MYIIYYNLNIIIYNEPCCFLKPVEQPPERQRKVGSPIAAEAPHADLVPHQVQARVQRVLKILGGLTAFEKRSEIR